MKLVFASANQKKLEEMRNAAPVGVQIVSMVELGITEEIPETSGTLQGNALQKAKYVQAKLNMPCFSDDTGLEIDSLDGRPGVDSAIYAGEPRSNQRNIEKVLSEMSHSLNRSARFKTVIAFVNGNDTHFFEGQVEGIIGREIRGEQGFGYDGIFHPMGNSRTFAEMHLEEKKLLSHRARALTKFIHFLQTNNYRGE